MAEALLRQLAAEAGLDVEVRSAGVHALPGSPASPASRRALSAYSLSLSRHTARHLDDVDATTWDLILTMTQGHRQVLLDKWPNLAGRVHVLKEYLGVEGHPDVADPFGGSDTDYQTCAGELAELLRLLVDKLRDKAGGDE